MAYKIIKHWIPGLPHEPYRHGAGRPEGIVLHETGTWGSNAEKNRNFETRTWTNAFVHFFVDWTSIIQVADTDYLAYGVGPAANQRFIQVELVRTKDPSLFHESYARYVWLIARLLHQYGLKPERRVTLWTHRDITQSLGGTRHTDPDSYLAYHGYTVDRLIRDIKRLYSSNRVSVPRVPQPISDKNSRTGSKLKASAILMRKGDRGARVQQLQKDLIRAGYPVGKWGPDGSFGDATETAVRRLQHDFHLTVDGIFGSMTKKALAEAKAATVKKQNPD
ncbi:N-acetylmuramoyl-L-alanine amidase [Sporolactobacillus sp. THM7-4]|nr:N-acetylmuramoyl-L-alanine amidase [Sporolactobacillus sp. THM7-4]